MHGVDGERSTSEAGLAPMPPVRTVRAPLADADPAAAGSRLPPFRRRQLRVALAVAAAAPRLESEPVEAVTLEPPVWPDDREIATTIELEPTGATALEPAAPVAAAEAPGDVAAREATAEVAPFESVETPVAAQDLDETALETPVIAAAAEDVLRTAPEAPDASWREEEASTEAVAEAVAPVAEAEPAAEEEAFDDILIFDEEDEGELAAMTGSVWPAPGRPDEEAPVGDASLDSEEEVLLLSADAVVEEEPAGEVAFEEPRADEEPWAAFDRAVKEAISWPEPAPAEAETVTEGREPVAEIVPDEGEYAELPLEPAAREAAFTPALETAPAAADAVYMTPAETPSAPAADPLAADVAARLEALAERLRRDGFGALGDAIARGDRLDASLALLLAGFRAGRGE
jgi:hypothetical protein